MSETYVQRPLRIAQVAPPLERVPPAAYGGTERVVHELTEELVRRGHDVTVFASADSTVPCRLVPTVQRALWPSGFTGDPSPAFLETMDAVFARDGEFDVIHSHLEWWSLALARSLRSPFIATFHGRLDVPWSRRLLARRPSGLVAISRSQASVHPEVDWTVIHNGLSLDRMPVAVPRGDGLCFVGRIDAEKGILEAIEIATLTGRPLRIAARIGSRPDERAYYQDVFKPAIERAGRAVEYLGELATDDRNRLYAESYAALMPGAWPEPFGLVAIEALACGTPLLARRVGALPEIVTDGIDGFFGDDAAHLAFLADRVTDLDRAAIRRRVITRFSAARMGDAYEALYDRLVDPRATAKTTAGGGRRDRHMAAEIVTPANLIVTPASARAGRHLAERPVTGRLVPVGPGTNSPVRSASSSQRQRD